MDSVERRVFGRVRLNCLSEVGCSPVPKAGILFLGVSIFCNSHFCSCFPSVPELSSGVRS